MNIQIHDYELKPKFALNNFPGAEKARSGFLLKVDFGEQLIGYADCHPWLEFGDLGVEEQKKN